MPDAKPDHNPDNTINPQQLILASSSPQRKALLQQIGLDPLCLPADIDESIKKGETAADYVLRLSQEKSQVIAALHADAVVLGADTTIAIGDQILGKADNLQQAIETLSLLCNTTHSVFTGVTVARGFPHSGSSRESGNSKSMVCETTVEFGHYTTDDIRAYWKTGEPQGKAGSYAIQGLGAIFVKSIHGSYSNVVGLPLHESAELLKNFGVPVLHSGK